MRVCLLATAMLCVLVLATPAAGQRSKNPTELWAEYPLVPKVKKSARPSAIGPFLPPVAPDAAPSSGEPVRWSLWLTVATLGLITAFVGLRTARAAFGTTTRVPAPRPLGQYAPTQSPLGAATVEGEAHRSVVRSTGFVRARFVVVEHTPSGERAKLASSRSFWDIGSAARRERGAEDAWDDLVNDLRTSGWEPDHPERSDFYVLLRPIDQAPSIVPSIDAYVYDSGDDDS